MVGYQEGLSELGAFNKCQVPESRTDLPRCIAFAVSPSPSETRRTAITHVKEIDDNLHTVCMFRM